jgi:predicted hydrocarbon binding protein
MDESDSQEENQYNHPVAFFLMPIDILKGVHEELSEILGPDVASKVIYNCGVRSGKNIVKDMNINFPDLKTLCNTLPELWLQMGMGVFSIEKLTENDIVLKCKESNEAMALGYTGKLSCDLTSGYLAGMISTIFGREFSCCEKKCTSKGDSFCVFDLKPVE